MAKPREKRKDAAVEEAARPRIRRVTRVVMILCVITVLLPTLLTVSGQHKSAIRLLAPRVAEAVSYESLSTHWWEPVHIYQLEVADLTFDSGPESGDLPLATINRISTKQSLWEILISGGHGIELVAEQPLINLAVHDDTTNLETTVARILDSSEPTNSSAVDSDSPSMKITVVDGTVRVVPSGIGSAEASQWTTISNISGTFSTLNTQSWMPEVLMVADLQAPTSESDDVAKKNSRINPRIAATLDELAGDTPLLPFDDAGKDSLQGKDSHHSLSVNIGPADLNTGSRKVSIELWHVDLAELTPLISRFVPGVSARGEIHGRLQARLVQQRVSEGMVARVQLLGEDVQLRHSSWVAGESAEIKQLTLSGAGAIAEDGALLNQLQIKSALLNVRGQGEVRHTESANNTAQSSDNEIRIVGNVDLAALSRMIPRTLKIQPDIEVDSLAVQFSGRVYEDLRDSERDQLFGNETDFRWQAMAETSAIEAKKEGSRFTIPDPIRLDAMGVANSHELNLVRARLTGVFGSVNVDPLNDGYNVTAKISPEDIWDDLNRITNLPPLAVHGPIQLSTAIRRHGGGTEFTALRLHSKELFVDSDQLQILDEGNLFERLTGSLKLRGNAPAVKALISPWHNAFWLANNSRVAAGVSSHPGQHLNLTAVVEPANSNAAMPDDGFVDRGSVEAIVTMDERRREFGIEKGVIQLPGTTAEFNGTMSPQDGVIVTNVTAEVSYDLESLSQLVGGEIKLKGLGEETFHITGAPSLLTEAETSRFLNQPGVARDASERVAPLMVTGGITWQGGEVYGVPIGAGGTSLELRNGRLRAEPFSFRIGSGQARLLPQWDLVTNRIQLAQGSAVEEVDLSPQLASEWLSYVSPILSDAADVSGRISCRIQNFDWYVDQPHQSQIQAMLDIHGAAASPGASLMPLLQVAETVSRRQLTSRRLTFPQQQIPVEFRDGMVIHNGLQFSVSGYDVSSFGAVGMAGQVQLTLDVPLERTTAGQTPRSVKIPVYGTVQQPRIDAGRLLQSAGRQQLENKVQKELNRGLNRLLDKL